MPLACDVPGVFDTIQTLKEVQNLTSNPKGPLDDIVKEKFKKTVDISK